MPSFHPLRLCAFRLIALILFLFASAFASAETSYWVGDPLFDRDFVLEGDSETPARDGVAVTMSAIISTTTSEWASYRFAWNLEVQEANGDWSQVGLVGTDTKYSSGEGVLLTADSSDEAPSAVLISHEGSLPPDLTLDPYSRYRIVGQLQRQPAFSSGYSDVEAPTTSDETLVYHFTNTTSGDNARNVIATLDSAALDNPFILDGASSSAKRGFTVAVNVTARRWDAYDVAPTNPYVTFRLQVELRDASTGSPVPLANSTISVARQVPTYDNGGSSPVPSTVTFPRLLNVRPLEQLDPVNGEYDLRVTVTHVEETSPSQVVKTGNTRGLDSLQFFHFNGALDFSGSSAILKDFTRMPQPSPSTSASYVSMTLNGVSGHLAGETDYTYSAPAGVSVRLFSDGTAAVEGVGATIPVTPPNTPDIGTSANVRFERDDLELNAGGLRGDLRVFLPQGMGYTSNIHDRTVNGMLWFNNLSLTDGLNPQTGTLSFNPGSTIHVLEETKPASILASEIVWDTAAGTFDIVGTGAARYVREEEANFLLNAPLPAGEKIKADNAGYYSAIDGMGSVPISITAAADSSAKLSAEFLFRAGQLKTHFPHGSEIFFGVGNLAVQSDQVIKGKLDGVDPVTVSYGQSCADVDCDEGTQTGRFIVDAPTLAFTPDGGLVGGGNLIQNSPEETVLSWGYIDSLSEAGNPVYAHSLGDFQKATFHMTGHFIGGVGGGFGDFSPGADGEERANEGPGDVHLSAVLEPQDIARPGSTTDAEGTHNYAGVNLKAGSDGDIVATAVIAGKPAVYSLRGCNKFYVRQVGVTGTVEAVPGSFPGEMEIYGYPFNFDYYGLAFLDSTTSPSRSFTAGSLSVPYPSDEVFEFEGLSFTCLGGLDAARLPDGGLIKNLGYWNADLDIASLRFVTSNSCDPAGDSFAALGVSAYSTLIGAPLHGVVGIRPDGELIHRDFSRARSLETEITSRLRTPNRIEMDGPEEETYELTAVSEAYFNDHQSSSEQSAGQGRLNFAAKIAVPFFEDLAAHVRTTASKNFNPDATLHLMGGWDESGETYFNSLFFDPSNRAFPSGVAEALYRNESGASGDPSPYLIHARQEWLNVVQFDYPLEWSTTLRSFTAYEPTQEENLLIVQIDHQLEYLSAENAEITFGAVYEGLPRINLTNFVFNKIDEGTGALQAVTTALQGEAVGALENGLDSMETLLSDQVDALLEEFLSQTVDPIITQLYDELEGAANVAGSAAAWQNEIEAKTRLYLVENPTAQAQNIRYALRELSSAVDDASSFIHKVDTSLEEVQLALRTIHSEIYRVEGGVSLDPPAIPDPEATIRGLLAQEGEEFTIVETLVAQLISEVAGEVGSELAGMLEDALEAPTGELSEMINGQLETVRPTLERLREVIATLDGRIGDVRDQLALGGEFIEELDAILVAADAQIVTATEELQTSVESLFASDIPSPDFFDEFTEEELKQRVRQEIADKLRSMDFLREYQLVLRQRLYDLDLAIKEGIDTAFGQVNVVLKNLLSEYLTQIDDEINGFLGDLDSVLGAGELDGFAHINGDALRLLRIDAYLQLKVPDDMEFNGYLQIKQFESDGSGSCSYGPSGTLAKEVTMGAFGVPVSWISPGMKLDVDGKVTFTDRPVGLGGSIEMVEGEIGFESFTITDLGAAMSFGATENYLAAEVGLMFQSYSIYGGVFFGRTCSIAPLELVNPQVASVLGTPDPTFSGAYVYGEAHIPVSEALLGIPASCMFKITAGVGAGAFYFVEGPTFGGQIMLAASGEALCLVGIKGDISMVGAKVGDDLRYNGRGRLSGKVGSCPFCVKFGKTIELEYSNDRWSFDL